MPLTELSVKALKPAEKTIRVFDGHGLYLEITPTGRKYWRLKYRHAGKERLLALGVYPRVTLAQARDKFKAAHKLLEEGQDPSFSMSRRAKRAAAVMSAANSFEAIAREWWEVKKKIWVESHANRIITSFEKDVFPQIGCRPVREITTPELMAVLRTVEKRGVYDTLSRVQQRMRAVFRYAIQTGRAHHNPAAELGGVFVAPRVKHREALAADELPEFLFALKTYPGTPEVKLGIELLLLTFVRPGELRWATWDEFDLEGAVWRIPAERMKMRAPHLVPLSKQTIEILRALHALTGHHQLLFPGSVDKSRPISENTFNDAIRKRLGFAATSHGFRATASTILNEQHFRADAIERQLAHTEKNRVRAAYHRSEYLEERKQMMQWWADYLDAAIGAQKLAA